MPNSDDRFAYYKKKLLEAALDYARAKIFNGFLNSEGTWEMWGLSDSKMYKEHYLNQLGQCAVHLLQEMSVGDVGKMP